MLTHILKIVEVAAMFGYGHIVLVTDEEGRKFVCTLETEVSELACEPDSNQEVSIKFEKLTERERSSCVLFIG